MRRLAAIALVCALGALGVSLVARARSAAEDEARWGQSAQPDFRATEGAAPGYVPDAACARCHREIATAYRDVGMARSWYRPRPETDIEDWERGAFDHPHSRQRFEMRRRDGRVWFRRIALSPDGQPGAVFERAVDWVLGSGNSSRIYLYREPGGELFQLPVAWYTQERRFAMAPGFDRPDHQGVRRRVRRECVFCHNAYPDMPAGSDRRDAPQVFPPDLPEGIGCQRCHGPGAAHVAAAVAGDAAARAAAIVNPARLPPARQSDVCLQCHLQPSVAMPGVRRFGRGDWSFRPGESLADYLVQVDVEEEGRPAAARFEINHHPYRLRQSLCNRDGAPISCLTCHDPHRRIAPAQREEQFRAVCQQCHVDDDGTRRGCGRLERARARRSSAKPAGPDRSDCVSCHMPRRRTEDVVHVVMTDHRIQRPSSADLLAPLDEREPVLVDIRLDDQRHASLGAEGELYRALAVAQASPVPSAVEYAGKLLAKLRPSSADPYFALAEAQLERRDHAAASRTLATILSMSPGHPLALEWRGIAVASQGGSEEALADLRAAVAAPSPRPEALFNLGRVLFGLRRYAEALPALERAVALRTNFAEAWLYLGRALQALGRESEAPAAFARAQAIEPAVSVPR